MKHLSAKTQEDLKLAKKQGFNTLESAAQQDSNKLHKSTILHQGFLQYKPENCQNFPRC